MSALYPLPIDRLAPLVNTEPCCVVLDSACPSRDQRYSFFFGNPRKIISCSRVHEVRATLDELSFEAQCFWVAGYCTYEAGYGLEERFDRAGCTGGPNREDLVWFGIYDKPYRFDHVTGKWNPPLPGLGKTGSAIGNRHGPAIVAEKPERTTRRSYETAVKAIQEKIAAGDAYQVNYTFSLPVSSRLRPWELYLELRKRQPVAFSAFIKTGKATIASFSPELFFMRNGSYLTVKPMKGTAPRGRYAAEDRAVAQALANDPKNRSENVMIVDLLRNDLGRICRTGSITVKRLFEVERHPTLHQMTSTVGGRLKSGMVLADILRALFPCGSVTGAPKIRAMEIIRDLEQSSRGVYCGAIGYASPSGRSVFSVPIRTLSRKSGATRWRYGAGSGIVADSVARDEWNECAFKCAFLTKGNEPFRLFESMLCDGTAVRYGREHCRRLKAAAAYFGFPFDASAWDAALGEMTRSIRSSVRRFKARIFLDRSGAFSWEREPLHPLSGGASPALLVGKEKVPTRSPFLFHKTTFRPWYEAAMRLVKAGACFDIAHQNEAGELTEGARSNLFVRLNGILYTPPVECGLLPGVLRGRMLSARKCRERVLYPGDLKRAEAVYCGNSVRGLVRVSVKGG